MCLTSMLFDRKHYFVYVLMPSVEKNWLFKTNKLKAKISLLPLLRPIVRDRVSFLTILEKKKEFSERN
jgi:hypothetical protein